nr:MSMEG_1061 family FMN-dependent PPOX-type flavoprotein [Priestia endophytica]
MERHWVSTLPPGFVSILDNNHLLIPERRGNKRMDSLRNILKNPYVGLLFLIPGMGETLRVNGKATLVKDEELLKQLEVEGKVPLIGILVEVEECFIHCAKAFKRSSLWEPEHWLKKYPSAAKMLAHHVKLPNATEESIQKSFERLCSKLFYVHSFSM